MTFRLATFFSPENNCELNYPTNNLFTKNVITTLSQIYKYKIAVFIYLFIYRVDVESGITLTKRRVVP